jgi:predicted nucleic acid-binding protein
MAGSPRPSPPSVFVDTSVLFAASHSRTGSARHLMVATILGHVTLVLSPFVVDETRRNLERKSPHALSFFEAFLTRGWVRRLEPPPALVRQVAITIDAKDAEIVAGAIHADVVFLATYDRKHLLSKREEIRDAFGILVATPDEILASLDRPG